MRALTRAASLAAAAISLGAAAPAPNTAPAKDILTPYGHISLAAGQSIEAAIEAARHRQPPARSGNRHPSGARTAGAPAITSGALISNVLTVGDPHSVPVIQFQYATGPAGINSAGFTFTSPNGQVNLSLPFYAGGISRKGNIILAASQAYAPYFAQPGHWKLTGAYIGDNDFNFTNYTAAQAAALIRNPEVRIANSGPVDITPPVVTAGKVLTPTVSLSSALPQFVASLSGTDDLSGVAAGFVIIEPPGGSFGQTQTTLAPIAFTSGSLKVAAPISPGEAAGTWNITGFILCDAAQNCSANTQTPDQVKALFGTTTFTVTN